MKNPCWRTCKVCGEKFLTDKIRRPQEYHSDECRKEQYRRNKAAKRAADKQAQQKKTEPAQPGNSLLFLYLPESKRTRQAIEAEFNQRWMATHERIMNAGKVLK